MMSQTSDVHRAGLELAPFAATLARAANRKDAFESLVSLTHRLGFENLSLTIEQGGTSGNVPALCWTTLEADRHNQLETIGFGGRDPVRSFARRVSDPFVWSLDDWPGDRSASDCAIMAGLQQVSIDAGITVMVWGRAGRLVIADAFACRQHVRGLPAFTADILFLATAQTVRVIDRMATAQAQPTLTAREIKILELSAQGLSARSIAGLLHIVEPTVKFHVKSIRDKLNVRNKAEAVARFAALGPAAFLAVDRQPPPDRGRQGDQYTSA